jgi:hypothetical protein
MRARLRRHSLVGRFEELEITIEPAVDRQERSDSLA